MKKYILRQGAYLQDCEVGFPSQGQFLSIGGVGIVSVVIEPFPQDLDGFFGEVSAALPCVDWRPRARAILLRAGVFIRRRRGIALTFADYGEKGVEKSHERLSKMTMIISQAR